MSRAVQQFTLIGVVLILCLLSFVDLQAQQSVGIGTTEPNPNAILELKSDRQGILVPRLSTNQRLQMAQVLQTTNGNEGMIVFDSENGKFYYWFSNQWNEGLGALPTSTVNGDLSGNLPNPTVAGLQGRSVSSAAPINDQVLKWNGTAWVPSPDIGIEYKAGNGITIVGDEITNTGDLDGSDDLLKTDVAGGDLSGTFDHLTIRNNVVTTAKISDDAVTTTKIMAQGITTEKIADNAVTLDKIANGGNNTFLSIDANGVLHWENRSNIVTSTLGEGKILIGNSASTAEERTLYGDVIIAFDGEATVVDNSINSAKIIDGSISTEDIADAAITKEKIDANVAGDGLMQAADGSIGINTGAGLDIAAGALSLSSTGVSAETYGQPDKTSKITIDTYGRIIAAEEIDIAASPVGPAGGDLSGSYPDPGIRDGAVTETKLANHAVGLEKIKTSSTNKNSFLTINDDGEATWFKPGNNKVVITTNDGQIFTEGRDAFATSALPEGNIFVGNSVGQAYPFAAYQAGRILIGTGSTLSSVEVKGDINIDVYGNTEIQSDRVTSDKILDGTIQTVDLGDGSVSEIKIADNAVTTDKIANNAVTSAKILDGTIANADLNKTAIPLSGFGAAATDIDLGNNKLINVATPDAATDAATKAYVDGQVDSSTDLDEGHVYIGDNSGKATAVDASGTGNILVGDGTTVKAVAVSGDISLAADGTATINSSSVTSAKIADGAIITGDLADDAVTTSKISDNAVTNTKISDAAVTSAKILDGSIQTVDLEDESVTNIKLADGAVTSAKILDGTVANTDLDKANIPLSGFGAAATDVDLGNNKLINVATPDAATDAATKAYVDGQVDSSTDLSEGHVYIGGNSGKATAVDASGTGNILVGDGTTVNPVAVTGDISLAADGTATINNSSVSSAKIADGAVTSAKILDGSIQTADLEDGSITNIKLADGAVTSAKILDGTVTDTDLDKANIPLSGFGAAAADVSLGNNKLTGVANPTAAQDAATKSYVDTQVNASTDLSEGHVYIGDNSGKATAVDASGMGNILVGDGTTVNPVAVSGDISLATDGTATINNSSVTSAKIADGAIITGDLADDAVTNTKISDGAVTSAKIFDGSIQTEDLRDESVTNIKLADGAVTSAKILDGTVADTDLDKANIPLSGFGAAAADLSLGNNKLTNVAAPTAAQDAATKSYVDTQVNASTDLSEGHVYIGGDSGKATAVDASGTGNILVGDGTTVNPVAVSGDISLAADGTATINNSSVTSAKISDGAVTSAKILDGTVADTDLDKANIPLSGFGAAAADLSLGNNKLTNVAAPTAAQDAATKAYVDGQVDSSTDLHEGHVYIGGDSGKATAVDASGTGNILVGDGTTVNPVAVSGDISLAANGTATINNSSVTSAKIADGAIITGDLADDAVTTSKISDNAVTNTKISDAAVTSAKILDGSIQTEDLRDESVTDIKLADGAVTSAKILDGTVADTDLDKASIPLSGFGAAAVDVSLGNNKLTGVANPTAAQDAATKNYVDTLIGLDGDRDDENEIQDLSLSPSHILSLSLSSNTVDLNPYLDNTDAQNLGSSKTGNQVTVTIDNGTATTFDISDGDTDPTNESLTAAVLDGTDLKITESGNETIVDLSSLKDTYTAGSAIEITGSDIAAKVDGTTIGINSDNELELMAGAIDNDKVADGAINFSKMANSGAGSGQVMIWSNILNKWTPGNATSIIGLTNGDITSVTTPNNSGLQGGGESGDVILSLANSGNGEILIGNGSNINSTTVSGAITLSSSGTTSLNAEVVQNNHLADNAVTSDKLTDGSVTEAKLASSAVTTNIIIDGAITSDKIGDGAVTSEKLDGMSATEGQVMTFKSGKWTAESPVASTSVITRTAYYAVDPLDFVVLGQASVNYISYPTGTEEATYVAVENSNDGASIAAPIHLPHGAIIQEVSFYYMDNENGVSTFKDIHFQVMRKARRNGTNEEIASFTSSGASTVEQEAIVTAISNGAVDNSLYSYRVIATLRGSNSYGTSEHRIYSVIIKYSETIQND